MTLEELLEDLMRQHDAEMELAAQSERSAFHAKQRAAVINARIRGMEEAREMLSVTTSAINTVGADWIVAGNGAKRVRRARRDIVALVKEVLDRDGPLTPTPEVIAGKIGCGTRQVVRALAKLGELPSANAIPDE